MIFHRCKGTLLPPEQYCVSNNNITQGLCVWWTFKWISIMCETYCFVTLQFSRTSCKGTLLPPEQYCVSNNNITQGLCVWWTFKWISIMCETYCFVTLQFSRTSCKGTLLPPEQYCVSNNNITQGLCVWWTFKWISIMCETYCFVTLQFSRTSETIGNSEQSFPVISRQQCVCVWYVRYRLQDIRRIMLTHINTVKCHSPCSLCVGPGPSTVLYVVCAVSGWNTVCVIQKLWTVW